MPLHSERHARGDDIERRTDARDHRTAQAKPVSSRGKRCLSAPGSSSSTITNVASDDADLPQVCEQVLEHHLSSSSSATSPHPMQLARGRPTSAGWARHHAVSRSSPRWTHVSGLKAGVTGGVDEDDGFAIPIAPLTRLARRRATLFRCRRWRHQTRLQTSAGEHRRQPKVDFGRSSDRGPPGLRCSRCRRRGPSQMVFSPLR
jgi:hypothetical protein